jgi:hypothetical protein
VRAAVATRHGARSRLGTWLPLLVPGLLLSVWVFLGSPEGHYSGDSGAKLIQSFDLWRSGFASRAIHESPAALAPARYPRVGTGFELAHAGHSVGIYSVVFAALEGPLLAAGGLRLAYLVPLVGGWMCLAGLWLALRRMGVATAVQWAAGLLTALFTPILFYSGQFFEHTLAAGLTALGLALLTPVATSVPGRERPLAGGALLGAAAILRPEAYCAVAAAGLALVLLPGGLLVRARRGVWFLLGATPVLSAYWALDRAATGTWDPLVSINTTRPGATLRSAMHMLWGEFGHGPNASFLVPLALLVVVGLAPSRWKRGVVRLGLHGLSALLLAVCAFNALRWSESRIMMGLFAVTPIAAYGLLAGPWDARARLCWSFALLFVPLVLVLETSGVGGGLQLGARLLLPALVPLVVLAAYTVDADLRTMGRRAGPLRFVAAAGLAALVLLSVVSDLRGTAQGVALAHAGEVAWREAASAPGPIIVAKLEWHAGVLSPAILRGKELVVSRDGDDRPLFRALARAGVSGLVYTGAFAPTPLALHVDGDTVLLRRTAEVRAPVPLEALSLRLLRFEPLEPSP